MKGRIEDNKCRKRKRKMRKKREKELVHRGRKSGTLREKGREGWVNRYREGGIATCRNWKMEKRGE